MRYSENRISGVVKTFQNVTECNCSEQMNIESEIWYRAICEHTHTAMAIIDEDTTIILANAEFERLSGYRKGEIEGKKSWTEFVVREDYHRMLTQHCLRRIDPDAAQKAYDFRFIDKTGQIKDINLTIEMIPDTKKSVASLFDVTACKRAEIELRESQKKLMSIIDFLPDATLIINKDMKVIAWNRAMEAMTDIKAEDMIGKGGYEYALPFYGERRPMLVDLVLCPDQKMEKRYTAIRREGDILFGEAYTPYLRKDTGVHISATASVLRDSNGEIIAAIECLRDNTERKMLEERLHRAEKMEALGTLAGGVAHDLNNVLGSLAGYSELLLMEIPEGNPWKGYVSRILQSSQKAATIIQDLLTLARRGVAVSEVVNINNVISDFFKTPECEKLKAYHPHVVFTINLDESLLNIKGSPVHLEKTVMNLISNAAEAISTGGEVTIRTENRYIDKPIRGYDDIREGDYVVLTVSDNGSGIASMEIKKIFEPFYTKKVMGRSGTGLGLAVVWGTVKDHNGYINVQSENGKGSKFTIYFPATREELVKAQQLISPEDYMGKGESILVVDDVYEQREVAVTMLTKLGYKVHAVSSGEAAVAYLKIQAMDLLVLDMIMDPGIDGLETYRRILEINPKQKAVIVSGYSETDRIKKARELGAGAYVRKPYLFETVGLAIRRELN